MQSRSSWTKTILDPENGTILTRTPYHWLLLIIFYTIFFCGIISLWLCFYWVFDQTLTPDRPKWLLTQPGFSFEPATTFRENYLKIEYHEQSPEECIVKHINKALEKYGKIPLHHFGECQQHHNYGYKQRKPCFFLKINRIIGFKTQPLDSINDLPHEIPQELYDYLQNLSQQQLKQRIWVHCESTPTLKFLYYPQRFYEISEVDYNASTNYNYLHSNNVKGFYNESDFKRIIAVQIKNISVNIKHHVRCFLWAKNIARDLSGKMGRGLVRFSFEIIT